MGYFRNAPSENQWANRGAQFLFVVVVSGGSVCSACSITEAGGQAMPNHWEWENERERDRKRETQRGRKRETETKRRREKGTWGWGWRGNVEREREIERELRPVEIHHNVRHTDALQPKIHHRSCVCRHNWTQESSGVEGGQAKRGEGRGGRQIGHYSWTKAPVRFCSAAGANHVRPRTWIVTL